MTISQLILLLITIAVGGHLIYTLFSGSFEKLAEKFHWHFSGKYSLKPGSYKKTVSKKLVKEIEKQMSEMADKRKFLDFMYQGGGLTKSEYNILIKKIEKKLKTPKDRASDWLKRASYEAK